MGLPPLPWPPPPSHALVRWALGDLFDVRGHCATRELHVRAISEHWCCPMPLGAEPGPWLLACAEVSRLDPDDPLSRLIDAARAAT